MVGVFWGRDGPGAGGDSGGHSLLERYDPGIPHFGTVGHQAPGSGGSVRVDSPGEPLVSGKNHPHLRGRGGV